MCWRAGAAWCQGRTAVKEAALHKLDARKEVGLVARTLPEFLSPLNHLRRQARFRSSLYKSWKLVPEGLLAPILLALPLASRTKPLTARCGIRTAEFPGTFVLLGLARSGLAANEPSGNLSNQTLCSWDLCYTGLGSWALLGLGNRDLGCSHTERVRAPAAGRRARRPPSRTAAAGGPGASRMRRQYHRCGRSASMGSPSRLTRRLRTKPMSMKRCQQCPADEHFDRRCERTQTTCNSEIAQTCCGSPGVIGARSLLSKNNILR